MTPSENIRATEVDPYGHLPAAYQDAVREEARRVEDEIVKPLGLPERRVLIVGYAGYIGTVLARHLLRRDYLVRGMDCFVYDTQNVVVSALGEPGFEFALGDLADEAAIDRALDGITDVVVLGGLVGDPITKKYPDASDAINLNGMRRALEAMNGRGLNKVIFVSTCSNYGQIPEDAVADESYELKPLSLYAKAKVAAEKFLLSDPGQFDFRPTVLRFATAFGMSPRMRFDLTVSEFCRDLYFGKDLLVYDAHTWRPYCHVEDFGEVIRRVLEAPVDTVAGEVFNAGGEENNMTKQMIVDTILSRLPDAKVRYQPEGPDPRNYRVDFTKIRERLHFKPLYTVEDGVDELIAALDAGLFADIENPAGFHGNYTINYPNGKDC